MSTLALTTIHQYSDITAHMHPNLPDSSFTTIYTVHVSYSYPYPPRPLYRGPYGGVVGGLNEGGNLMSLTPQRDMVLESSWGDQTGNVGEVGNIGNVGKVEKGEKSRKIKKKNVWKLVKVGIGPNSTKQRWKNVSNCQQCWCKKILSRVKSLQNFTLFCRESE